MPAPTNWLVFARKPAPVQISWLGYPGPAGVSAIDHYLSDPFLEPPAGNVASLERTELEAAVK